jgi:hypothetical protein
MQLSGRVTKKLFGKGSKSERQAVVLNTEAGQYVLRRRGGNPFHDPELEKLVGKTITANGDLVEYNFIMTDWEED